LRAHQNKEEEKSPKEKRGAKIYVLGTKLSPRFSFIMPRKRREFDKYILQKQCCISKNDTKKKKSLDLLNRKE